MVKSILLKGLEGQGRQRCVVMSLLAAWGRSWRTLRLRKTEWGPALGEQKRGADVNQSRGKREGEITNY